MSDKEDENANSRKREHSSDSDSSTSSEHNKMPNLGRVYYTLAPESPTVSGPESVQSVQARETDIVQDTSDTETRPTNSPVSDPGVREYEPASSEHEIINTSSTNSSDMGKILGQHLQKVLFDDPITVTDTENSWNSDVSRINVPINKTRKYDVCIQCFGFNNTIYYRYCTYCFDERKKSFPPRPRVYRQRYEKYRFIKTNKPYEPRLKTHLDNNANNPVKNDGIKADIDKFISDYNNNRDNIRNTVALDHNYAMNFNRNANVNNVDHNYCVNLDNYPCDLDISKITPEDCRYLERLIIENVRLFEGNFEIPVNSDNMWNIRFHRSVNNFNIYVAENKENIRPSNGDEPLDLTLKNRQNNDSDNNMDITPNSKHVQTDISHPNLLSNIPMDLDAMLCKICHNAPINSIFLHTNLAHMCCCYNCAKRTWQMKKRCPICNGLVLKVIRLYMA